jgi:glycosyltransferase involved in cell wall biosynthesis
VLHAIHFHGVAPCLLGARALKRLPVPGRVLYSVHDRHLRFPMAAGLLGCLLPPQPVDLVPPQVVDDAFFAAARTEDPSPSVIAQGAVDVVTWLAVLLNGRGARVGFSWLGSAQDCMAPQLEAASIATLTPGDTRETVQALARAWLFVAMSPRDPLALGVAQAMAAGVPCLVSDLPAHRALIDEGRTGFVCRSERDLVEKTVMLLRDRGERRRIGEAARAEAGRRFTERHYHRALLRAYGLAAEEACSSAAAGH